MSGLRVTLASILVALTWSGLAQAQWQVAPERMQFVCLSLLDGGAETDIDVRALERDEERSFYAGMLDGFEDDDPFVQEWRQVHRFDTVLSLPVALESNRCSYTFPAQGAFVDVTAQLVAWSAEDSRFILAQGQTGKNPETYIARACAAVGAEGVTQRYIHMSQAGEVLQGAFAWTSRKTCKGLSLETLQEAL